MRTPSLLVVLIALGHAGVAAAQDTVFVAPTGVDSRDGRTSGSAVRSLERGRDLLRARRASGGLPRGGVLFLLPGDHLRSATFVLGPTDGGTDQFPLVIAGDAAGTSRMLGAVPVTDLLPVTDPAILARLPAAARAYVRRIPLAVDVTRHPGSGDFSRPRIPELFTDSGPLALARWPDTGWVTTIGAIQDSSGTTLVSFATPPGTTGPGAFFEGYFYWDWRWGFASILSVDDGGRWKAGRESAGYGWRPGQRIAVLNAIERIDRPGTYAADSATRTLYVWPPAGGGTIWIGDLSTPVIRLDSVSNVSLHDLVLGPTGGALVKGTGGRMVSFDRVVARWSGSEGIVLNGGTGHRVTRSTFEGIGGTALDLQGGDRRTLTPSGIVVEDDHIRNAGRIRRTMRAVVLRGVGIRFAHNEVAAGDFEGILVTGNDHQILDNDLHDLLRGARDAGAIYFDRDWTERGTLIKGNWIHAIGGLPITAPWMLSGVYLDDAESGVTIVDNLFSNVPTGVHVHGGHDNSIAGNLFVCVDPALYLSWIGEWVPYAKQMRAQLDSFHVDRPPYSRYPGLSHLDRVDPWTPRGNRADSNTVVGGHLTHKDSPRPWALDTTGNQVATRDCAVRPSVSELRSLLTSARAAGGRPRFDLDSVGPRSR